MISKFKVLMIAALLLVLLPMNAFSADPWLSGETHFYWRVGLTGGGTALDGISGASMCPTDGSAAISGNSVYFYTVSVTGNESGTTVESSPDWIMPNTASNGQTLAGVSMWKLLGVTGVTAVFKTLVLDNRTVTGSVVDLWNAHAAALTGTSKTYVIASPTFTEVTATTSVTSPQITGTRVMGGITDWQGSVNCTLPSWLYQAGELWGSGVSVQLSGISSYQNAYLIVRARGGVSIWGEGAAANSSNGMKFHSDYGAGTTGIWIPLGDYDSKVVLKFVSDASGTSIYAEAFSKTGSWKTATGSAF